MKKFIPFFAIVFFISQNIYSQNTNQWLAAHDNRYELGDSIITYYDNEIKHTSNKDDLLLLYSLKSLAYRPLKKYPLADSTLLQADSYFVKKQSLPVAVYLTAKARYYEYYDISDKAAENYIEAFSIFQKLQKTDWASDLAVYVAYYSPTEQLKFSDQAYQYAQSAQDTCRMINALLCKADYIKTNVQSDKNSKYNVDSIVKYSSEAVQLIKNESTLKNKQIIAKAYFNHGYFLFTLKHNAEGKEFLDKALSIAQKYHFGNYIARYYGTLGVYAQDEQQYDLAKSYFLNGLEELHKLAYTDPDLSLNLYRSLRLLAAQQSNNWDEYKIWDDKYNETFDEVNKQETQNSINAAIVKYDLKKKEEKIQLLTEKNNFKSWLIISLTTLFFVGLITLYLYRKSQKIKWLLIKEHNKALEKEKTDTQKELLSSILHLEKKNEILNDIKEKLMLQNKEKPATVNNSVFKIIDEGILVDDDFEKFKSNFNPIYPDFFNQLQQQSNHSFTQLDLKYCAFILMKLSNKEIAQQLNIEPKSVRMARYRIKQKLNLNKDEDLDNYIQVAAKNT